MTARTHVASVGQIDTILVPEKWSPAYSETDQKNIVDIIDWLNTHKRSLTWITKLSHVNRSTFTTILKGGYPSPPDKMLRKVLQAIGTYESRNTITNIPFIPSTVSRMVWTACQRARQQRSFAVLTADVGTGKTRALQEYANEHPNTFLIQSDPLMSPTILMDELMGLLGIPEGKGYRGKEAKYRLVLKELTGTDVLLILDEAETVSDKTLHYIRRIRDKAGIGIVLAGTSKLDRLIAPIGGQFDQIRSRVMFWPKPIRSVTKEDIAAVVNAAFADVCEVDLGTHKALWHHSKGSMRMLVEGLIPGIRDYGLKKHDLSADLVHAVAKEVLSLY